jgi:predicted site-specific integrase-resolvase
VPVSSLGVDLAEKIHAMLVGELVLPSEMSPAACFWWAERLAAAVAKTPPWLADVAMRLDVDPSTNLDATAWLAAAEIVVDWRQRLEAFLDEFQRIDKHRTTSTGVGRRFGMLLRHAVRLEDLGHPAPADALRHYLTEKYDGGHLSGKVCLFRKPKDRSALRKRSWITQTTAAKILGLRHGAIAPLIEQGLLAGRMHSAGTNGRSVGLVTRQSVDALRRDLQSALDIKSAASRLGIGRHAVLDLIHRGILPRAVHTAKGWQIPLASVADLESVYQRLPAGRPTVSQWISLRQATRQFGPSGLSLGALIEFILPEEVRARMAAPEKRLNGIVVSQADLASLAPRIRNARDQARGYPIHQLARVLFPRRPIKPTVLTKWIAAGFLKSRKTGRARIVSSEEVERFRSEYCLADKACRLLGISRSTLSRWEVEGRIRPVYGKRVTPGAGFSLYRREDLTKLVRRRRPRRSK